MTIILRTVRSLILLLGLSLGLGSPASALPVIQGDYKLPASFDPTVTTSLQTELWARVYRPDSGGPYPLLVFLHGNHATCGRFSASLGVRVDDRSDYTTSGTCPAGYVVAPSHLGYAYLANALAAKGYVVVSINANRGINAAAGVVGDNGLNLRRGRLVLRHLQELARWNTGAQPTGVARFFAGGNAGLLARRPRASTLETPSVRRQRTRTLDGLQPQSERRARRQAAKRQHWRATYSHGSAGFQPCLQQRAARRRALGGQPRQSARVPGRAASSARCQQSPARPTSTSRSPPTATLQPGQAEVPSARRLARAAWRSLQPQLASPAPRRRGVHAGGLDVNRIVAIRRRRKVRTNRCRPAGDVDFPVGGALPELQGGHRRFQRAPGLLGRRVRCAGRRRQRYRPRPAFAARLRRFAPTT